MNSNGSFYFAGYIGKYKCSEYNNIDEEVLRNNVSENTPTQLTLHDNKATLVTIHHDKLFYSAQNNIRCHNVGTHSDTVMLSYCPNTVKLVAIESSTYNDMITVILKHCSSITESKFTIQNFSYCGDKFIAGHCIITDKINIDSSKLFSVRKRFSLVSDGKKIYRINQNSKEEDDYFTEIKFAENKTILKISCGNEHAIILTSDNRVFTYGNGSRGQLGNGTADKVDSFVEVELLQPVKIIDIAAGGWHSLVLSDTGDLYSWGWNESGQVGTSEETLVFLPALVDTPLDLEFKSIALGARHSTALTKIGDLFTWGWNGYGQLFSSCAKHISKPTRVNYFAENNIKIADLKCGHWSTLVKTS